MFGFEHFVHLSKDTWVRLFAGQATPFEVRCCSGGFALMPVLLSVLVHFGPLWFPLFVAGFLFAGYCWIRFIPAKVSWVLGAVLWLLVLWLALTGRN